MHQYRALHVMAIDSGTVRPFVTVTLTLGEAGEHPCSATKTFDLAELEEVRDMIDWAAEAYAAAFEELHTGGWSLKHHSRCQDGILGGLGA